MGNFSRDTFDPAKGYVAVRLQQGVPLVDADWNETNDVVRQELYDSLATILDDGVEEGSGDLRVVVLNPTGPPGTPILLLLQPGSAIVGGRRVLVPAPIQYTAQPWLNPARAAADGVDVIPPPPPRVPGTTDLAYLDVWEREIDSAEDGDLVNPAIGVETAVRLKREVALRIASNTTTVPAAPPGHQFMPLAPLFTIPVAPNAVVPGDARPVRRLKGTRTYQASFVPAFLPVSSFASPRPNWFTQFPFLPTILAFKPAGQMAIGVVPLMFPQNARLLRLNVVGHIDRTSILFTLNRVKQAHPVTASELDLIVSQTISVPAGATERNFNSSFAISTTNGANIVDNSSYHYSLCALSSTTTGSGAAHIEGIAVRYSLEV